MKTAIVPFSESLTFNEKETLNIEKYKWVNNFYTPRVDVFLCHNNEKLRVKFNAYEDEISVKAKNDNEKVYCDSCVEFFVCPFDDDMRYVNFEVNPVGAMIMLLNKARGDSEVLVFKYKALLNVVTACQDGLWSVQYEVPFSMLSEIYGKSEILKSGDIINANFYKCGDETKQPHYGMWNEITQENASFHTPQYFGQLVLE